MPTPLRPSGFDRAFADRANDLLGTLDLRGFFTYVNASIVRLTLLSEQELLARPAIDLVPAIHRDEVRAFYARQIDRRIATTYYELPILTARNRTVWLALHAYLWYRGSRVAGLQVVARDLTERKLLEWNLERYKTRERQIFESWGRITGELARDFNTLLMIITGLAEGAIERLPATDPSRIEMQQILDAGWRGVSLAAQLLSVSRKPASQMSAGDFDELLRRITSANAPGAAETLADRGPYPTAHSTPAGRAVPHPVGDELVSPPPLSETILIVDDEAPVRVLLADALRRQGYRVLTAPDATVALGLLRQHLAEVRLLLTDMVMPGKHGRELAREAQQLNPKLPVLLMSGYPDRSNTSESWQIPRSAFLQKPFTLDVLARRVRQMLDEHR